MATQDVSARHGRMYDSMGIFDYPLKRGAQTSDLCPNCSHRTSLRLDHRFVMWPKWESSLAFNIPGQPATDIGIHHPPDPHHVLHVFHCTYCEKSVLVRFHFPEAAEAVHEMNGVSPEPDESAIVWPTLAPRELPAEAPTTVASLFREASTAETACALRGAAGLYRATVEALVADRQAQGQNLNQKIDDLANQGVDADIVRDLHDARLTGNWSLHDGGTFTGEEISDVAQLIEDAVEILYVQPARRAAMAAARAARRGQTP